MVTGTDLIGRWLAKTILRPLYWLFGKIIFKKEWKGIQNNEQGDRVSELFLTIVPIIRHLGNIDGMIHSHRIRENIERGSTHIHPKRVEYYQEIYFSSVLSVFFAVFSLLLVFGGIYYTRELFLFALLSDLLSYILSIPHFKYNLVNPDAPFMLKNVKDDDDYIEKILKAFDHGDKKLAHEYIDRAMKNEDLTEHFIHGLIQETHDKKDDILELFSIERVFREIGQVALIDVIKLLSYENKNIRNMSKDILLDWIVNNPKQTWIHTLSAPQKKMLADYLIVLLLEEDNEISDIAEQGLFMLGEVGLYHICELFYILYEDEETLTEGNKVLAVQIAVLLKKWREIESEAYAQWVKALSQEQIDTILAELPDMTRIINVQNKDYSILEELGEILLLRGYEEEEIKQYGVRGVESDLDLKASFEGLTRKQRFSAINLLIAKLSDPLNDTAPKTTLIQLEDVALCNVLMALNHHDKTIVSESAEILKLWRSQQGEKYETWLKNMSEEEKEKIILFLDTLKDTVSEEDISLEITNAFEFITDPYDLFPLSEKVLGPGVLFSIIAFLLCISDDDDDLGYIEKYMNYLEQKDNSKLAEDVIFMNEFFTSIHLSHDINLIKFVYILLRSIVRRDISLSDYLDKIQE